MDFKDIILEIIKALSPLVLAYIALLRHRIDLDIIAAKQRGGPSYLRKRWYSFIKQKSIDAFEQNHMKEIK